MMDKADPSLNTGLFRLLLERAEARKTADPDEALADLEYALSLIVPDGMKLRARAIADSIRPSVSRQIFRRISRGLIQSMNLILWISETGCGTAPCGKMG